MSAQGEKLKIHLFITEFLSSPAEEKSPALLELLLSSSRQAQQEMIRLLLMRFKDFDRIEEIQEELREKIEQLTAPPGYQAVLVNAHNGTGPERAVVAIGSGQRTEVAIHPELDRSQLQIGHIVVLNNERNCIIQTRGPQTWGGELAEVEQVQEDGRLVLSHRDDRLVVEPASSLRQGANPGDLVRFDRSASMAYEIVVPPKGHVPRGVVMEEIPQTTFAQIGGLKEQVQEIQKTIVLPLMHPEQCRRYRLLTPRGVTLWGPPGCGKTMVAQALAHHLAQFSGGKGRFILIKGPELLSMWVGESERKIREVLRAAREQAARTGELVFIFWDEIDAIARARGSSRFSSVEGTIIPTLLSEIQGFESEKKDIKVIICAATNRIDLLDVALIRPGRLGDLILEIPRPSRSAAQEIMGKYLTVDLLPPDGKETADELIEGALSQIYASVEENKIATLVFRDGGRQPVWPKDLMSGAVIEKVISAAARRACWREIDLNYPGGIEARDLSEAIEQGLAEMGKNLRPHNVRDHLPALSQDREVVAVEPVLARARLQPYLRRA